MSSRNSSGLLTLDMIKKAAEPVIYSRGRSYFKSGMVYDWNEEEPGVIAGTVRGSGNKRYKTMLDFRNGFLLSSCTCPYDWSDICKHAVALALEYLSYENEPKREPPPQNVIPSHGRSGNINSLPWQNVLDKMVNRPESAQEFGYYRVIYRLNIDKNGRLTVELYKARIGKRGKGGEDRFYYDLRSPGNFVRDRDRAIMGLLSSRSYYNFSSYIPEEVIDPLFRLLIDEEYVFLGSSQIRPAIALLPVEASLILKEEGENHKLEVSFEPKDINEFKDRLFILGENRPWLTDGFAFYPLETELPGSLLRLFLKNPQVLSKEQISLFMEHYYDALLDKDALEVRSTKIQDVHDDISPRPVLYLEDGNGGIVLKPCFAYGDGPPQITPGTSARTVKATIGDDSFWVRRQIGFEEGALKMFEEVGVKLERDGVGRLDGDSALGFLQNTTGVLRSKGWEIVGELKSLRLSRTVPKVRGAITSGIDWFDLNLAIGYGDVDVDFSTVLAAYRSGRQYIRLDDGSWGILPLDWLKKAVAPLEELSNIEGQDKGSIKNSDRLKIRPYHIPLAEEILTGIDIQSTPAFESLRKRLNSFKGIEEVDVPSGLTAGLRDYQKRGLDWLGFLSEFSFGGILADDMGLGKTIQTLAHFLRYKEKSVSSKPSLIVAPTSVAYNWQEESLRFTPELKVVVLTGPERHQHFESINEADLVITTYALLRRDFNELSKHAYHYIILDEAQFIKNPAAQTTKLCKSLTGNYRLALTGTPLENNLTEVWSIFDFLMPGLLGSHKSFQERYEKPIAKAQDKEAMERLKRRLRPFILRRVKQDVARELPPKTEIIAHCGMTSPQKTLYEQVLNTYRAKVFEAVAKKGIERSQITILDALLKLRQVCNHPQLLKVASNKVKTSGKMELFQEMVEELVSEGHRALVFSQFTQMLAIVRQWLDHKGIHYCYLDGRTRDRSKVIKEFNENGTPLFLISLKAGGTGLNLTVADYVIHIDPWWNPAVENQATDRAHRIGQDKHVFVYKMITKDSIEEKILKLQKRKKELFDSLLSEGGLSKSLTREDLEELFSSASD